MYVNCEQSRQFTQWRFWQWYQLGNEELLDMSLLVNKKDKSSLKLLEPLSSSSAVLFPVAEIKGAAQKAFSMLSSRFLICWREQTTKLLCQTFIVSFCQREFSLASSWEKQEFQTMLSWKALKKTNELAKLCRCRRSSCLLRPQRGTTIHVLVQKLSRLYHATLSWY